MQKKLNTNTTHVLFEIVSVFVYSVIDYLRQHLVTFVKFVLNILQHSISLAKSYIVLVYEFRAPANTVKLHFYRVHTQYITKFN